MTSDAGWGSGVLAALVYGLPVLVALVLHLGGRRRAHRRASSALAAARAAQLTEPPSLHPAISPSRCLGCGSCVQACPEGDVLGLVAGKAALVNPTHCIGHGACRDACPFDAITLVLGTAERGVEIPRLGPDFQTAVPGVFVAGELGGMGLIRNAIEQGRQAVESIRRLDGIGRGDGLDLVIVGAGPAGLSASLAALQHRLRFATLEQESLGGTVAHYPRGKLVMTTPAELPLVGRMRLRETSKEALLAFWQDVVARTGLRVRTGERVEAVKPLAGGFEVCSTRGSYRTRAVLLAIGRRGTPARLGVRGEDRSKVVYRLVEPAQYRGQRVLVVGGGDSALEAAVAIADEPGTEVTLAYRGAAFSRAKPANRQRFEALAAAGRVRSLLGANLREVGEEAVRLVGDFGERVLPNDAVIVCAGGVLPTAFLHSIGIATETKHGTPVG